MTTLNVDVRKKGAAISPLLFGHNLEHTRSCVWQGLAAQMLRNRKFAGKPDRAGQAMDWYPIGPDATWFLLDWVMKDAWTTHFDMKDQRRYNEINAQVVESATTGKSTGIGQHGLALFAGRRYETRLVLKSGERLSVRVRFAGHDPRRTLFERTLVVAPGGWRKFAFRFSPRATDEHGRIEITFDRPGRLTLGATSLLPADHFHGMRRDVVARLKEIAPTILRWPGGNFAGDYRWQDGLLDVDQRAPQAAFMEVETFPHSRGVDCHEIGTDEFIALCREVGAEPFITVNLAWDTPERAAAWVEYCNGSPRSKWGRLRARRGHAKPCGVRFWSLGNELGYTHMEGPNAPSAYAKKAVLVAKAMKRVDRSITLCSSGKWDIDRWYPEALKPLSRCVDLFSHHYYTQPIMRTFAGEEGRREFRRVVATPRRVLEDIRRIRARADAFTGKVKRVDISFDEWNVWYAWYRKPGVADGIHTAAMLNMFCREAAGLGVPVCCYFEPVNEGAILVDAAGSRLTPVGQAFALFKPHRGRTMLRLGPSAGGEVDAAASLDERTGEIVVTLVNLSPEHDRDVTLRLVDAEPATRAEVVLLSSRDFRPASRFAEKRLSARVRRGGRLTVRLPRHGVARIRVSAR